MVSRGTGTPGVTPSSRSPGPRDVMVALGSLMSWSCREETLGSPSSWGDRDSRVTPSSDLLGGHQTPMTSRWLLVIMTSAMHDVITHMVASWPALGATKRKGHQGSPILTPR